MGVASPVLEACHLLGTTAPLESVTVPVSTLPAICAKQVFEVKTSVQPRPKTIPAVKSRFKVKWFMTLSFSLIPNVSSYISGIATTFPTQQVKPFSMGLPSWAQPSTRILLCQAFFWGERNLVVVSFAVARPSWP